MYVNKKFHVNIFSLQKLTKDNIQYTVYFLDLYYCYYYFKVRELKNSRE